MAVSAAAMLLDELMGRDRNLAPTEKRREVRWDDPETCKYFLCGFCPHELFVNTRADLGPCDKIHDEELKKGYAKSSRFERMGYEEEFMRFLQSLLADVERRIKRGHARLALNSAQQSAFAGSPSNSKEDQLEILTARINNLVEEAEELGCEGKVEEAQSVMRLCEQMREERLNCEQADKKGKSREEEMAKKMEVCNVCGALLVAGDAQQRIDEHIMGKQHMGYARIRAYIEQRHSGVPTDETAEMRMEKERVERERIEEEEKRRLEQEQEREKERERRRRSRSRSSNRSLRHRRSRSGSRGRRGGGGGGGGERDRNRDRDRERINRRDRSRERRRRTRSRERSRDRDRGHERRRSRSRSRRSHSKSSSRRSSRDRDRERRRSRSQSKGHSQSRDHKDRDRKPRSSRDKDRDADKADPSQRSHHNGREPDEQRKEKDLHFHHGEGDSLSTDDRDVERPAHVRMGMETHYDTTAHPPVPEGDSN